MKHRCPWIYIFMIISLLFSLIPCFSGSGQAVENVFGAVRFNEIMTSAAPYYSTQGYDWIELYNTGNSVSLKGWKLVLNNKKTYVFPSGSLAKGKYIRIYATDDPVKRSLNTGFPLPAKKGTLELFDPKDQLISRISWKHIPGNISYGLLEEQGKDYVLLSEDTPGKKNCSTGYPIRSAPPSFSPGGGAYSDELDVELCAEPGYEIRYTTDGTTPDISSSLYTGPIHISENTVIRAISVRDGEMPSADNTASYLFDIPDNVRLVSVVCDPAYLYSSSKGILVSGSGSVKNYSQDWEVPANIEYYNLSGTCEINQSCGMKVAGGISRQHTQKSLAFFARKAYGSGEFLFNPFPHRDYTSIKSFVLRNGGSEGLKDGLRFRDAMLCDLAMDSVCLVSDGCPALVYVNGELYGHCNIREKTNKYFIGKLENVPEDLINQIDILTQDGLVSNGNNKDYKALSQYCRSHDLNKPEYLSYVTERLDVESLFDCMAFQMITGNADMHNLKFYRVPGGKWKWMIYDMDTAMRGMNAQPIADLSKNVNQKVSGRWDHIPFAALMRVPEMRSKFFTRMGELIRNVFTEDRINEEIALWHDQMEPIIAVHCTRWTSLTPERWETNIRIRGEIMRERPAEVIKMVKKYFKLSDREIRQYFGNE